MQTEAPFSWLTSSAQLVLLYYCMWSLREWSFVCTISVNITHLIRFMNGWTPLHLERKVKRGETSYIIKFHSMTCMCVCMVQYGFGLRFLSFFPFYMFSNHPLPLSLPPSRPPPPSLSPSPLSLPLPPTYAGIVLFCFIRNWLECTHTTDAWLLF